MEVLSMKRTITTKVIKVKNTAYYNIKIDDWKLQLIIDVLEEKLNSIPDGLVYIASKSNLKNIIEELKLPF